MVAHPLRGANWKPHKKHTQRWQILTKTSKWHRRSVVEYRWKRFTQPGERRQRQKRQRQRRRRSLETKRRIKRKIPVPNGPIVILLCPEYSSVASEARPRPKATVSKAEVSQRGSGRRSVLHRAEPRTPFSLSLEDRRPARVRRSVPHLTRNSVMSPGTSVSIFRLQSSLIFK